MRCGGVFLREESQVKRSGSWASSPMHHAQLGLVGLLFLFWIPSADVRGSIHANTHEQSHPSPPRHTKLSLWARYKLRDDILLYSIIFYGYSLKYLRQ